MTGFWFSGMLDLGFDKRRDDRPGMPSVSDAYCVKISQLAKPLYTAATLITRPIRPRPIKHRSRGHRLLPMIHAV
jgi:hypothetical protein